MKTWYYAVCDERKEFCEVMVNSPLITRHFTDEANDDIIRKWLDDSREGGMRLISTDEELSLLYDNNYRKYATLSGKVE